MSVSPTTRAGSSADVLAELRRAVGEQAVRTDEAGILQVLKDNSWLSPLIVAELERRREAEGPTLGIVAVVRPSSEDEVVAVADIAVRHRVAVTPRGAGTSNFGLLRPDRGGILLDLRGLAGSPAQEGAGVRCGAGALLGELEQGARAAGREVPILTTTYQTATVAGWVCGGHVGLGSSVHGSVWDDAVLEARIVTFSDAPAVRVLGGGDAWPVLHTFGVAGVVTELVLRTDDAHPWLEATASFPTFEAACRFVEAMSLDRVYRHRVVTAQEAELMPAFHVLDADVTQRAGVLMLIDAEQETEIGGLALSHGGSFAPWQPWQLGRTPKPSIAGMVYGHRMLWVKHLLPDAAFLHVYFDPKDPLAGVRALKDRFGDGVLLEMKYVRSPRMLELLGFDASLSLPAAVIAVVAGAGGLDEVMAFCRDSGIPYQNPHTSVIEDSGMFPDVARLVEFKAEVDPYNLLNPGKLRSARERAA